MRKSTLNGCLYTVTSGMPIGHRQRSSLAAASTARSPLQLDSLCGYSGRASVLTKIEQTNDRTDYPA